MIRPFYYLKLGITSVRMSRDPENTELVFDVADTLYKLGKFAAARRFLDESSTARAIIDRKTPIVPRDLRDLAQLPEGNLGRSYAEHMLRYNLDPDFYRHPKDNNDATFILLRIRQTHDLWHVVTGFDTSRIGEVGLQGFQLAQTLSPLSAMIVGSAILRAGLLQQEKIIPLLDAVAKGWMMGRRANSLFAYDWDSAWTKDLEAVRSELNVMP